MVTFVHLIDAIQISKQKFMICKFCSIGTQSDMLLSVLPITPIPLLPKQLM